MTGTSAVARPTRAFVAHSDARRMVLLGATLCVALVPILICWPIPALLDYPNHLARMSLLARAAAGNPHPDYEVVWSFMPNLAMDLVVPWLARWMRIETAGLLFLVLGKALLVLGAATLERVVKGRIGWTGYAAIIALWAAPFAWGFVNFEIGMGICLFALAGWLRLARQPVVPVLAIWHALACAALYSGHLFALGIYGWSVGICELWRWHRHAVPWRERIAITLVLALPPLALVLTSRASGASIGGDVTLWSLHGKALFGLAANGFSQATAATITAVALMAAYVVWRRREAVLLGPGGMLALSYVMLFVIMPSRIADTQFVEIRVVVAAFFVLPAFIELRWRDDLGPIVARTAIGALICLTTSVVALHQLSYAPIYRAIKSSFESLPPGARVLLAYDIETNTMPPSVWDYPLHHAATLVVIHRDVYVPTLFMHAGMQPLRPAPHHGAHATHDTGPLAVSELLEGWAPREAKPGERNWSRDFDYLYVFELGGELPATVAENLRRIVSGPRFTLYRIERPR